MSEKIDLIVNKLAETCYVDQLRSDVAYHKKREIKNILMAFQGIIIDEQRTKTRDLERRLYIAEKAVADSKL
jgi:hypothetical protein